MNVTLKDFQPVNEWKLDSKGEKFRSGEPVYLIDQSTGRKYLNEDQDIVRFKCLLLSIGTPFVHAVAGLLNVAYRILKLVTFSHFWMNNQTKYNLKERFSDAGSDLLKIIATPISYFALELAALYGLFRPYDGRKLYASIERGTYSNFILAPCFQPNPKKHAFGGKMSERNVF